MHLKIGGYFVVFILLVDMNFIVQAADPTIKEEQKPETLEDIGVRILNALIRFGKTELTKAQVNLLQKMHPEKSKLYEQMLVEDTTFLPPQPNNVLPKMLPILNDQPQKVLANNWITVSNATRFHEPIHVKTPMEPSKSPTEQMAKIVMDRVQKQLIPDIVKKLMHQRQLPELGAQRELRPTMMSPEEQQRRRHLQHERIFQKLIDEQDHAKIVQPLRIDIKSQINPLPPDKRLKMDEEENQIRPSFKLEKDTFLVNGSSEGDEELEESESTESIDSFETTNVKRVLPRGNAIARRFLLMK